MSDIVPKGYSRNHYPLIPSDSTHEVFSSGLVPVYTKYFESIEPPSPSENSAFLKLFLSPGDQVVVLDNHIGPQGVWTEIMIPGDSNASNYNLFVYNSDSNPVLQPHLGYRQPLPVSDNFETRDYSNSLFSYDNRQSDVVFYDNVYKHYVVKISQPLHSNASIDRMLKNAIVKGSELISSAYGVSLPSNEYSYLSEQYSDFFKVFDYSIDIRGNDSINVSSLICYVTVKSKYFDNFIPILTPTTEEIAKQEPQYKKASSNNPSIRTGEYIDSWLDPSNSPLDAESFLQQYSDNFQDQLRSDFDFRKNWEDLRSRGTRTPSNIIDILSEELSETPIVGSDWLDNQSDQARSEAAVAKQDLERAIGSAIDDMFNRLGFSSSSARALRTEVRSLTSGIVSVGASIEDVNDLISSVVNTLENTPDIYNMETGEFKISPSEIVSVMAEEMGLYTKPSIQTQDIPDDVQAAKTIEASISKNFPFAKFFEVNPDSPDSPLRDKYPIKLGDKTKYYDNFSDNLFTEFTKEEAEKKLYSLASKIIYQSRISIPHVRVLSDNNIEILNKDKTRAFGNRFSGLRDTGVRKFYKKIKESINKHKKNNWAVNNLDISDVNDIEEGINKKINELLSGLIRKNIVKLANQESSGNIILNDIYLSLGFDSNYSIVFAHLNCSLQGQKDYYTFAFTGADEKKHDIDNIISPYSYGKQVGLHLYYIPYLSDLSILSKDFEGKYEGIAAKSVLSQEWRAVIKDFFIFPQAEFKSPSENPEVLSRDSQIRALYQNTKGRTEQQAKEQLRAIAKFKGTSAQEEFKSYGSSTEDAQEAIFSTAAVLTKSGKNVFETNFSSTEELSEELIRHIGTDVPLLEPFVKCLFPEIDLEKIIEDTEQYKLLKDMQDSILAAAESSGAALDLYDTLEALFTPSEEEGGLSGLFLKALDKAIDLLILEAFKRTLEYIQVLCLKWQAFLMESITAALLGKAIDTPNQALPAGNTSLPGTVGPTSSIGNGVIASLALKGYSNKDMEILSSPEAIRYIEDISNLLTPAEFCQLMTKDDAPGYLKDIAQNVYDEYYKDTILSGISESNKLYSFLRTMGEFIDPAVCEAISSTSRLPKVGYSHTKKQCSDISDIEKAREDIISGDFTNSPEIRKILDNTAQKNADNLKSMLVEIEGQASGTVKVELDPSAIFNSIPEVKKAKKDLDIIRQSDLVLAINADAAAYSAALTESGKEYFKDAGQNIELGPMGYIYRRFAMAEIDSKLKSAYPALLSGKYPDELKVQVNKIIKRDARGTYKNSITEIASDMTEQTGVLFTEEDIENIRIANPRTPIRPFSNLSSATDGPDSATGSYNQEGSDRQAVERIGRDRFLENLRKELEEYTTEEKEEIIEMLRIHEFKIAIGLLDTENTDNLYYTSEDYHEVRKYLPYKRSQYEYSYSGDKIPLDMEMEADELYEWLKEATERQTEEFYSRYKDEEGDATVARVVFLGKYPRSTDIEVSPLMSYSEVSVVQHHGTQDDNAKYEISSDGNYTNKEGSISNQTIQIQNNNKLFKEGTLRNSLDEFFVYTEGDKHKVGGIIKGASAEKKISVPLGQEGLQESLTNYIDKNVRDFVSLNSDLFSPNSDILDRYREVTHYLLKQSRWDSINTSNTDSKYGKQIFNMLDKVRKNTTEIDGAGKYKNKLPEIITEHLLQMLSVGKLISQKEELEEKFKSPIDFVNQPSELERRDYSVEEKIDMWFSIKFFILTFVADYYLKMLPLIMSSDFFTDNQNRISKSIIVNNIEVFLSEDRGRDFEIFKKKFLYLSNVFWLFIKQEKCSEIDLSHYSEPMSAVKGIVEDSIVDLYKYLEENEMINVSPEKQQKTKPIIEVRNFSEKFVSDLSAERGVDNRAFNLLAESVGNQLYGLSLAPDNNRPATLNQYGKFLDKLDQNGLIYIDSRIIEITQPSNDESSERYLPNGFLNVLKDPRSITRVKGTEQEYVKYKLEVRLNFLMPNSFSYSESQNWKKLETDNLEADIFKQEQRVFMIDSIQSDEVFHDLMDPFGNGTSVYNNELMKVSKYLSETRSRADKMFDNLVGALKERESYTTLDNTLGVVMKSTLNKELNSLIYYSFYDYFSDLGNRRTFKNTRQAAINTFLKSDARGTTIEDFILTEPEILTSAEQESSGITFYEYWSRQLDLEYSQTPEGAAEEAVAQLLEDNPDASQSDIAEVSGNAFADALEQQAQESRDSGGSPSDAAALENEADEIRDATEQGTATSVQ